MVFSDLKEFKSYLSESFGLEASFQDWGQAENLPQFLRQGYEFAEMKLQGQQIVVMRNRPDGSMTPAIVRKHVEQIRERSGLPALYVTASMASFDRRRFIEYKIPFAVPGNQLYLPPLGIDLRDHFRAAAIDTEKPITPSAQVVLLKFLYDWDRPEVERDGWTVSQLAKDLGYAAMTMTRAIDEMEQRSWIKVKKSGKSRFAMLEMSRRELWSAAKEGMINPVARVERIPWDVLNNESPLRSGLSALASKTMIAEPEKPLWALSSDQWRNIAVSVAFFRSGRMLEVEDTHEGPLEGGEQVEIWRYDPKHFARAGLVDPLSLYLSLKDDPDERLQTALEELLEEVLW
jgi:DNA-binding MarR family transcriptional regulator